MGKRRIHQVFTFDIVGKIIGRIKLKCTPFATSKRPDNPLLSHCFQWGKRINIPCWAIFCPGRLLRLTRKSRFHPFQYNDELQPRSRVVSEDPLSGGIPDIRGSLLSNHCGHSTAYRSDCGTISNQPQTYSVEAEVRDNSNCLVDVRGVERPRLGAFQIPFIDSQILPVEL